MIKVNNLTKKYKELTVLENVNLEIEDGEIYGLVGVSGVGKSTLLGCLNGLEKYSRGSICIDESYVEKMNGKELREFRKSIGMIFQNFSLISRKTVYQNISFPMECWKYDKQSIDARVKELAKLVGIEDKLDVKPAQLSGGQKQRVAIARALTLNPKYLLCDECTSALDPKTTNSILGLLKSIHTELGITIVIVTHEMTVIKKICQKIGIMEGGRIVENGTVREIFSRQPEALLNLTGEERRKDGGKYSHIVKIGDEDIEQVLKYLNEKDIKFSQAREEVFPC